MIDEAVYSVVMGSLLKMGKKSAKFHLEWAFGMEAMGLILVFETPKKSLFLI